MTNQANQYLMAYLTGTFEDVSPFQNPGQVLFEEFDNQQNNLELIMSGLYFPFGFTIDGKLQGITTSNSNVEYSIIYGKYKRDDADDYSHSYILILDENYAPVQLIKNYSNDELFGEILGINYGEDGRFFLVEKDTNGYYRFVLLNNILVKSPQEEQFQIIQRQTYRIEDQYYLEYAKHVNIEKNPNEAHYVIIFVEEDEDINRVRCIEFIINVGSTNEWNYYSGFATGYGDYDYHISWNEEGKFSLDLSMAIIYTGSTYQSVDLVVAYKSFAGDTISVYNVFPSLITNIPMASNIITDIVFINNSDYYTSVAVNGDYYLFKNQSNTPIYSKLGNTYSSFQGIRLINRNNNIFFAYQNVNTYVGLIIDDQVYESEFTSFSENKTIFLMNVKNIFDLYFVYLQCGDYINIAKITYIDKKNNQPYYKYKSLVPYFGKLYDNNDKLLFSRTLYNKSINGQTTTSTIQVPNLFLNNVTIGKEKLVGKTYLDMIENETEIVKNEYEELFVNFANSINIRNENDPENIIDNPVAAARLNNSVSTATPSPYDPDDPEMDGVPEYINAVCFNYRINYDDGTYDDKLFLTSNISVIDEDPPFTRRYTFNVYNPSSNPIKNIQFMSNDKNTIYQTITNLNLVPNGFYTITQDVYVV